MSKRLEIKPWQNEEGQTVNALYVDGMVFDWALVEDGLKKAREYVAKNPMTHEVVYGDIQKHFLDSFAEFVGKRLSLKEINEAIEKGCIE